MRSLNIYTRKYFTFVCAGLGSRRGEVMTASICILIITRKNDRSGNLAKKLSRRECCKLVAVKSFEPILPWLVRRRHNLSTDQKKGNNTKFCAASAIFLLTPQRQAGGAQLSQWRQRENYTTFLSILPHRF